MCVCGGGGGGVTSLHQCANVYLSRYLDRFHRGKPVSVKSLEK